MNSKDVLNYIDIQTKVFEAMELQRDKDSFFQGMIEGMNIVKAYISAVGD